MASARLLMIMQNANGAAALVGDENGAGQQCVIAMITRTHKRHRGRGIPAGVRDRVALESDPVL